VFEKAGIEVTTHGTVSEVFNATGLNWTVQQRPIWGEDEWGNKVRLVGHVGNYIKNTNTLLGIVNPNMYRIVQNIEAFDFIDELPNFTFEKVGMFQGGKKVFVVGKSNEQFEIDSGDFVHFYFTFLHGHDGKSGIRFILCPLRMFCMNQLNLMLESASYTHAIKHTGNIELKLAEVHKAVTKSRDYVNALSESVKLYLDEKPDFTIQAFTEHLIKDKDNDSERIAIGKQEARDMIIDLYENKPDLQNYKGTAFGMLSAVSDHISHLEPQRKGDINNAFIRNIEGHPLLREAMKMFPRVMPF